MNPPARSNRRRPSDHGMVLVLLVLIAAFSVLTIREHHPSGESAATALAARIAREHGATPRVVIVVGLSADDLAFADRLRSELADRGVNVLASVKPADLEKTLLEMEKRGESIDLVAGNQASVSLLREADFPPAFAAVPIVKPPSYSWPTFLQVSNFRNIAGQIAVIAIVAIGMTFVVVTGGIDISVGSQIGLAAVAAALLIRECFGGVEAAALELIVASLAGVLSAGLIGMFNGVMVAHFRVQPFIVTLATMWAVRGLTYILAEGQSVYQIPASYTWLGRDADLLTIPNAVVLMLTLYGAAHVLMTRMTLGRYLYAVGGNPEAARLAGVPNQRVLLFAYAVCGLLAGLGGIILASQQKSAEPSYGQSYELTVIAAVVVGGASLYGGEGRIFGTLIGAFIIAVIQNGMNMMNISVYVQWIVFGTVILAAALLDRFKRRGGDTG